MKNDIIDRIAAHLDSNGSGRRYPVASEEAVGAAERELGLNIPPLLRAIYLNVANGGFGPGYGIVGEFDSGYGIIGVAGGHRSSVGTLMATFIEVQKGAKYLGFDWNPQLLPFCELGDASNFCVDCSTAENPVFMSDHCEVRPALYSLKEFFERWIDGRELTDRSSTRVIEMINPFTGKSTRIKGR